MLRCLCRLFANPEWLSLRCVGSLILPDFSQAILSSLLQLLNVGKVTVHINHLAELTSLTTLLGIMGFNEKVRFLILFRIISTAQVVEPQEVEQEVEQEQKQEQKLEQKLEQEVDEERPLFIYLD